MSAWTAVDDGTPCDLCASCAPFNCAACPARTGCGSTEVECWAPATCLGCTAFGGTGTGGVYLDPVFDPLGNDWFWSSTLAAWVGFPFSVTVSSASVWADGVAVPPCGWCVRSE